MTDPAADDAADVFSLIGQALAPLEPPPAARRRVLDAVMASLDATPQEARTDDGARTMRAEEGEWQVLAPLARARVLNDDGRFRSLLVRLEAGARLPPHAHGADEECYVVDGDVWLSGVHLFRGDFQLARPGHVHEDIHSDGGCLLHIRTRSEPLEA